MSASNQEGDVYRLKASNFEPYGWVIRLLKGGELKAHSFSEEKPEPVDFGDNTWTCEIRQLFLGPDDLGVV